MGFYSIGIDDRIDQAGGGLHTLWQAAAAIFLILLLVAAGVTIERAASKKNLSNLREQYSPTGFGELKKSSYAISETSGKFTRPKELVSTRNWRRVEVPELYIEMAVPENWGEGQLEESSLEFQVPAGIFGRKTFLIQIQSNPRKLDAADYLLDEVSSSGQYEEGGDGEGVVEFTGNWLLDGERGSSVFIEGGEHDGHYIAVIRDSRVWLFYAEDLEFSSENRELVTVLSTLRFLE